MCNGQRTAAGSDCRAVVVKITTTATERPTASIDRVVQVHIAVVIVIIIAIDRQ